MSGLLKKTILLLLLIFPVFVMADDGYIIKNYNIDIIVNKDNTFDITEELGGKMMKKHTFSSP